MRLGFLIGALVVSLSAAGLGIGGRVEEVFETFWAVVVRGAREVTGELDALVGDGFEPGLLASLLMEMLDGRWVTFFVATGAADLDVGAGSLDFPLVLAVRGVSRVLVGEPSGTDGAALVASVFLVTLWGDFSNDDPFRIVPSSGVSVSVNLPTGGASASIAGFWVSVASASPVRADILVGGDEVKFLSKRLLSPLPIEEPVNVLSSGLPTSSAETPVLNLPGLSSAPFTFLNPSIGPDCPLRSTATKLARTLERGRPDPDCSDPAGDRPREGGEVAELLLLLFSNLASRLRTPLWPRFSAMTVVVQGGYVRGRNT